MGKEWALDSVGELTIHTSLFQGQHFLLSLDIMDLRMPEDTLRRSQQVCA